ncbi:SMI1/KNR4 family protein [Mucilaginibacter phyllosphaerae]|uniref:SMI1/KNR4 family protein n=1 Tax=Mucilaginibacter phyllosphaerae TaxID=1812349 RepID=A0A4Y8A5L6_9SPHI|nr:SMI1/KNR4 family protein [Mucilaginibacter phyllosphaerae]MBB3971011.1 hypothetical protein [Mucilaginibacter phyllosphaerae]TEW63754.1 hypothetical protein E2R65_18465 [Mucilaginibacter phyllosphaerae]GGH21947.1 hypothetical protein GCM10007352_34960 [Mucilaginibacter phyllosphaerae]
MDNIIKKFFDTYFKRNAPLFAGYTQHTPKEMMVSSVDNEGYYRWKPIDGTLNHDDYRKIEKKFKIKFPESFIKWHKSYFFLSGSSPVVYLPNSSPTQPLQDIIDNLDNDLSEELIAQKLYPFATDDNDIGFFVFDAREDKADNEYPIRLYDHEYGGDLEGLSEILFSSFSKLLECLTYAMENHNEQIHEILPEFIRIDPEGAGKDGIDFWLDRIVFEKKNFENGNQ